MNKNRGFTPTLTLGDRKLKLVSGFTLIELLVVISVIGILAVIILTNLDSAGEKGANAGIKSNVTTLRTEAQLLYTSQNQSYDGFCGKADDINTATGRAFAQAKDSSKTTGTIIKDGSAAQSGDATTGTATLYCHSGIRFYVVSIPLRAVESKDGVNANFWCVDSKGFAGGIATGLAVGATSCN